MKILLDTHALIWFIDGKEKLPRKSAAIIKDYDNEIYVSVASIWEMTIKRSIGKLPMNITINEVYQFLDNNDIKLLNITSWHLNTLLTLPHHHRDPFDRLLIAQAISGNLAIISADQHFTPYEAEIIWQ